MSSVITADHAVPMEKMVIGLYEPETDHLVEECAICGDRTSTVNGVYYICWESIRQDWHNTMKGDTNNE